MPPSRAFVVGHPVGHSRSPLIHGFWLRQHRIPGTYEAIEVAPTEFAAFVQGFVRDGYRGGNVTLPHKEAAFSLADDVTTRARRVGAVNTLWTEDGRICGDNTDGFGFIANLDQALGRGWQPRSALVLGAGGAARGIVASLLDRGVDRVLVANRTLARAEELAALEPRRIEASASVDIPRLLGDLDLLVNTTSLGMAGEADLDLDLAPLPAHAVVADIVYVPLETPLLASARARGLRTVDGLGMLLHQAVPGFARWFGVTPQVTPELRAVIEADIAGPP